MIPMAGGLTRPAQLSSGFSETPNFVNRMERHHGKHQTHQILASTCTSQNPKSTYPQLLTAIRLDTSTKGQVNILAKNCKTARKQLRYQTILNLNYSPLSSKAQCQYCSNIPTVALSLRALECFYIVLSPEALFFFFFATIYSYIQNLSKGQDNLLIL